MTAIVRSLRQRSAADPSWTTLVAEAAGLGRLSELCVEVTAIADPGVSYRLVAQVHTSGGRTRPVAAAQLEVSAERLSRGVRVRLFGSQLELGRGHVIAWLEPGSANLEYDGLLACADAAHFIGRAPIARRGANIALERVGPRCRPSRPPLAANAA